MTTWSITAVTGSIRSRNDLASVAAHISAIARIGSPYVLPVLGLICFAVAAFLVSLVIGFTISGVAFFVLRYLIEMSERGEANTS